MGSNDFRTQVKYEEDRKGKGTILKSDTKFRDILYLGQVFGNMAHLMQYIHSRKLISNQETEFVGSSGTTDCHQLSDPAWPLRRNLVWTDIIQKVPLICVF